MNKIKIPQVVVVEGKCDKAVLENVIEAVIIPVNGFSVYKDKKKLNLICRYAQSNGVILLTDSDNAGRQIRNYLKDYLQGCEIEHLYVPDLYEVEDTSVSTLREVFKRFISKEINPLNHEASITSITRERLFDDGLIGGHGSSQKRKELLRYMDLPENLSVTALLDVLNRLGYEEYERWSSQA